MLWSNAFIASGVTITFSVVCFYLAKCLVDGRVGRIDVTGQLLFSSMLLLFIGMWVASEIAAADIAMANVLWLYVGTGALATGAIAAYTIGWGMIKERMVKIPLVNSMARSLYR